MEALTGFILPIIAGVITGVLVDCISKWLDRKRSDRNDQHINKKDRG